MQTSDKRQDPCSAEGPLKTCTRVSVSGGIAPRIQQRRKKSGTRFSTAKGPRGGIGTHDRDRVYFCSSASGHWHKEVCGDVPHLNIHIVARYQAYRASWADEPLHMSTRRGDPRRHGDSASALEAGMTHDGKRNVCIVSTARAAISIPIYDILRSSLPAECSASCGQPDRVLSGSAARPAPTDGADSGHHMTSRIGFERGKSLGPISV